MAGRLRLWWGVSSGCHTSTMKMSRKDVASCHTSCSKESSKMSTLPSSHVLEQKSTSVCDSVAWRSTHGCVQEGPLMITSAIRPGKWNTWAMRRSNQSILKEINPAYSLEVLMLKLQYFSHLMRRVNSLERCLILGKIEGRRRRGWQRKRCLDSITNSTDMNLSKLRKIVEDREAWCAAVHGVTKSWTQVSDWTTTKRRTQDVFFHWRLRKNFRILPTNIKFQCSALKVYTGQGTGVKSKLILGTDLGKSSLFGQALEHVPHQLIPEVTSQSMPPCKNPPCNERDVGSTLGSGRFHVSWRN